MAQGMSVDILVMQKTGQFLDEAQDIGVVDLGCNRTYELPFALLKYVFKLRPDVIVCNFWKLNLCACLVRLIYPRFRLLLWEHAKPSNTPVHSGTLYGITASLFYRMANGIVAVSNAVREDISHLTWGLRGRIAVISNPIPDPIRRDIEQSSDFVFVGRLDPQKNPMLALDAFAKVADRRLATLTFVGDGTLRGALETRVAELGLSSCITFTGFVATPASYMASAKVLVLTSDAEGFGNVLVEALYCGISIVSTDCGGPSDVLGDNEYGSIVPIGDVDAMARAMGAELDHPRDPRTQRERALHFSPRRIATQFLQTANDTVAYDRKG